MVLKFQYFEDRPQNRRWEVQYFEDRPRNTRRIAQYFEGRPQIALCNALWFEGRPDRIYYAACGSQTMTMLQIDGVLRIALKNIPKAAAGAEYEGSPPLPSGNYL